MALAHVRRILGVLGMDLLPEALDSKPAAVSSLELWIHLPHSELDGQTPMRAMQTSAGQLQVRNIIAALGSDAACGSRKFPGMAADPPCNYQTAHQAQTHSALVP